MGKLLMAVGALVGSILSSTASRVLADEFKAWAPGLTKSLIRLAAGLSPIAQRARIAEEWSSNNAEIPGEVGKLLDALGCVFAATRIQIESHDWKLIVSETWTQTKTWAAMYLFIAGLYLRLGLRRVLALAGFQREQPATNETNQTLFAIIVIAILYLYQQSIHAYRPLTPGESGQA